MYKIIIAFTALLLIACNQSSEKSSVNELVNKPTDRNAGYEYTGPGGNVTDSTASPDEKQQAPPQKETDGQPKDKRQAPVPAANPDWDKKIIKTASLNLEVKDFKTFSGQYREKIRGLGGYVAQEEQSQSEYKIENTIVIKVPVDQFDQALGLLTTGVEKINERKVTSQDVSAEYIDTKSRIEAKKQVRDRYTDLLKQAKNMEEILNVQAEINGIQEEIEAASGRIHYMGHAAAYSTISLTYYQVLNETAKDDSKPSLGTKTGKAFRTGWEFLMELFVGIVTIWPLLLAFAGIWLLARRAKSIKPKEN
jgi:Domain of unknown function (DUF4349)